MVPAILVLADGSVFHGISVGAEGSSTGEVVFNTAMTAYQEALTDPSYANQLLAFTYPQIGNVGINTEDSESNKLWAAGLIIRDLSLVASSFRSEQTLADFLKANNTVAIAEIDTRMLTRILREKGTQAACLVAGKDANSEQAISEALAKAKAQQDSQGVDQVQQVTTKDRYSWTEGSWRIGEGYPQISNPEYHVVVYDYGVKRSILRILATLSCKLTVVPANTPAKDVLALKPDGVFLSNGPGDASTCDYAISAVSELLDANIPMFGLCVGHQVLCLALGAKVQKLKHGHFGSNHPVQNVASKKVMITSQSHGFAVDEASLPKDVDVTYRSLFDGSLQGIHHKSKPAFSFQGYPESSSIPLDVASLYSDFIALMKAQRS